MAIDVRRVLEAALEAAFEDPTPPSKPKKRRLSAGRALVLGAGVMTAGRIVAGSKGREMFGQLQQRIADSDWSGDGERDGAENYEEEVDGEAVEDSEPVAEGEELEPDEDDDEELEPDEEDDEELEPDEEDYEKLDSEEEEDEPEHAEEDVDDDDAEPNPPRARRRGRSRSRD